MSLSYQNSPNGLNVPQQGAEVVQESEELIDVVFFPIISVLRVHQQFFYRWRAVVRTWGIRAKRLPFGSICEVQKIYIVQLGACDSL